MAHTWSDLGGGAFVNPELSAKARMVSALESRFYEAVTPAEDLALGKKHGDRVTFKIFGRITGTSTSPLSENVPVPFVTMPEYEVTAQVYQRGVAVSWTGQREDLDRLDIEAPLIEGLRDQSSRTHNRLIYDALIANRSFCYVPLTPTTGNFTTNGTPTGTANSHFNAYHARQIVLGLEKNNTPKFDGRNYLVIGSPTFLMGLFNDTTTVTGFTDVKKYTSEADGLLNGEIGEYFGLRFLRDNDVLNGSLDAIGTGSAYGSAVVCGLDAVKEIPVYPMELRAQANHGSDFGRARAVAWLSLLGYRSVWNFSAHSQGSVLHVTSA